MSVSPNNTPSNKSILDCDEKTFLDMLERDTTVFEKEAIALHFRHAFSTDLSCHTPNPSKYTKLISFLLNIILNANYTEEARINAAWAITNMTYKSSELNHIVVSQGGINALMKGVISDAGEFPIQCIWALGNIATDCVSCRDGCLQAGLLTVLADILAKQDHTIISELKYIVWCTKNIMRDGIPDGVVPLSTIRLLTKSVTAIAKKFTEQLDLTSDCLKALASIAADTHEGAQIDIVLNEPGLLDMTFEILDSPRYELHLLALRIVGNIASGNSLHTEAVISHPRFYDTMCRSLYNSNHDIRDESAWIWSNIGSSTPEHADLLFIDWDIYGMILKGAESPEEKFKKECMWTIVNLLITAKPDKVDFMIGSGVIFLLPSILSTLDIRLTLRTLHAMRLLLPQHPEYATHIKNEKWLNLVRPSLLEANTHLQELKAEVENIVNERAVPYVPPCTFRFIN